MKSLTFRYSITQFTYWAASSGAAAFATTYLLNKGVLSGLVGLMLAMAGLLSCLTQPLLASLADRAERFLLTKMLIAFSILCCICFSLQLVNGLPLMLTAVLYMVGVWSSDVMVPLLNALSVACNSAGYCHAPLLRRRLPVGGAGALGTFTCCARRPAGRTSLRCGVPHVTTLGEARQRQNARPSIRG